jgi:hypothetical protein
VVLKILHSFEDSVDFNLATFFPLLKIPPITASAFSIARYKIKIDLFLELNHKMNDFTETLPKKLWKGYRLVAGDGTTVNIPSNKDTIEHFGLFRDTSTGGKTVLANACMLYDLLSDFVLSSKISPFVIGEKNIMTQLIQESKLSDTIAIFDRGFSCFHFVKLLANNNLDFCMRLRTNGLLFADKILDNPSDDFVLEWIPSEAERNTSQKKGQDAKPIKVRATKVLLPSGEVEVLVSSLLDMETFVKEDIGELYRLRWNIEEGYKKLKPKMKLEQFGCKKPDGIYQEFYSHVFMMNLTTLIGSLAQETIAIKTEKRKFKYKYNWVNAYKFIKNALVELYQAIDIENVICEILSKIKSSIIAIVPGRNFIRHRRSIKKYRFSPVCK